MARTNRPWWRRAGPETPDWWISRKGAILIVLALLCWSFYVMVGRVCAPMIRGNSRYRLGRSAGVAVGILAGYVILWLMATWTYIKMIATGPGFAKKVVPRTDKPDILAYPPYPQPPTNDPECSSDDTAAPDPSEFAPVVNLFGPALHTSDGPPLTSSYAENGIAHTGTTSTKGHKKVRDWQTVPRPLPTVDTRPRWCRFCEIVKPDRTHHCRHCGSCVLQFDHHCLWIGQCVGWANHKVVGLIAVAALFGLFTFAMNATHVHLILSAQTTVESFSARDQREAEDRVLHEEFGYFFHNFERRKVRRRWKDEWGGSSISDRWVSGSKKQLWEQEMGRSPIGWILPFGRPLGDGMHYESNPRFGPHGEWLKKKDWPKDLQVS
ncbi:hypothetical protein IAU59_005405 [Kwoniella sp. CBS 9459]